LPWATPQGNGVRLSTETGVSEMKLIIANPIDRKSMTFQTFQDAFKVASDYLALGAYPDKTVLVTVDGEAGNVAMDRALLGKGAVLGSTDQGFDDDGIIRVMLARVSDMRMMFQTFLHELVHVEQAASGRSVQHDDGSTTYEGKFYPPVIAGRASFSDMADGINAKRDEYENLPWEEEARKVSETLIEIMDRHMSRRGVLANGAGELIRDL
jgi:hypothetical protein